MSSATYDRLMAAPGAGAPFDRHVVACILAEVMAHPGPLLPALGLDRGQLARLLDTLFPGALNLDVLIAADADAGEDQIEEHDFRQLLLAGRAGNGEIEEWLARMVVRRSMLPEHLWCSLGLPSRKDLSDMLHRHFPATAGRNVRNMRWKKFFYREMCQTEGVYVCKSPVCDTCTSFDECFGTEE